MSHNPNLDIQSSFFPNFILEGLEFGVVVHASNGEIVYANAAAEHLLGLDRDQILKRKPISPDWIVLREDLSPFPGEQHPASITLETGRSVQDVIMGVQRPQGAISWLNVSSHAHQNHQDSVLDDRTFPAGQYVIAQFRALNPATQTSIREERYRLAHNITNEGIWDINTQTGTLYLSRQCYKMLGYPEDFTIPNLETLKKNFIHNGDIERAKTMIRDLGLNGSWTLQTRLRVRKADTTWAWLNVRGGAVEWDSNKNPTRILGIQEDISSSIEAERRLSMARLVFDNSVEGIVITDEASRIIFVNQGFTEITGYTEKEALGQNPSILQSGRQSSDFYHEMWRNLEACGHWTGELWNRKKDGTFYSQHSRIIKSESEIDGQVHYIAIINDVTRLKQSEERLQRLAFYDPLTDLPNRILYLERLKQSIKRAKTEGHRIAIAYFDLDNFKEINDQYGHDIGDQYLQHVARVLKNHTKNGDTVARLGGDEFALVLNDVAGRHQCIKHTTQVALGLAETWSIDSVPKPISGSASVGFAFFPDNGHEPELLLRNADQAMYSAKKYGSGLFEFFDDLKEANDSNDSEIAALKAAFANDEFELYYQPKFDTEFNRPGSVEALLRWHHPERGILTPPQFMEGFSTPHLSNLITLWVTKTALEKWKDWQSKGYDLKISVNIDSHQIEDSYFLDQLDELLEQTKVGNDYGIELEVLETDGFHNMEHAAEMLQHLQDKGISVAIDDFGTGYSSLLYLVRLPFSVVKIDRSFIMRLPGDEASWMLVQAITSLTDTFKKSVIAEGIETEEQSELLSNLGVTLQQGYYFSRPVPSAEIDAYIDRFF